MHNSPQTFCAYALTAFFVVVILGCLGGLLPTPVYAATFDPEHILSDEQLTNAHSMSLRDIQNFLKAKGSYLAKFRTTDVDGKKKSAAKIIYDAAKRSIINPQYLLALLQKEQSLVEGVPSNIQRRLDWATGYGVCDSCSKNDPALTKYKGFANQIDYAAGANRFYIENPGKFSIRVGTLAMIDNTPVIPKNQATVNQYIYTPHIHGNQNLWKIWNRWFSVLYPNGTVLQARGDKGVWLISEGKKHIFTTYSSFLSRYKPEEIVTVDPAELDKYEEGTAIRYPNYSLLRLPNGLVYLIIGEEKRPIASDKVLRQLGYNPEEIIDVDRADVEFYKNGKIITAADAYPTGAVLKNKQTSELSYVYEGKRQAIGSAIIAKSRFPDRTPIAVEPAALQDYEFVAEPILLRDGTLVRVKDAQDIFIISDGTRRPIPSKGVFIGLGYNEKAILEVDEQTLLLHPEGAPVEFATAVQTATN